MREAQDRNSKQFNMNKTGFGRSYARAMIPPLTKRANSRKLVWEGLVYPEYQGPPVVAAIARPTPCDRATSASCTRTSAPRSN